MKIDQASSLRSNAVRRRGAGKSDSGGGFADALTGDSTQAQSLGGPSALGPTQALLALQEVPDASERGARAKERAEDLLDQLDDLRVALLSGRIPLAQLEKMAALAAQSREEAEDPRLAEVLAEIELRAAVELAKLGR